MLKISQIKIRPGEGMEQLRQKVARLLGCAPGGIRALNLVKQSIDARKKPDIWLICTVEVEVEPGQEEKLVKRARNPQISLANQVKYQFQAKGTLPLTARPVIVGTGPAGLFCGYFLAKHGYRPILLERGRDVDSRKHDVEHFWQTGELISDSNVQFGEGGAGTFSDGKLNTLIKDKDGKGRAVLELFHECGAPEQILWDNKPHIGTDILIKVVRNLRQEILRLGGEVRFSSCLTDVKIENGSVSRIQINHKEWMPCQVLVPAIGHSARDTFQMLYDRQVPMEAKAFAVGFRVEHPQEWINRDQYGANCPYDLPAASYKLAAQTSTGRGVYSFCMCPGGYVVNASSEPGKLAVNGMSYSARDGQNANSAIIVSVSPQDFGSSHPLGGIAFQRSLEERAYMAGRGKVPVQRYGDFRNKVLRQEGMDCGQADFIVDLQPSIKGAYTQTDLTDILPEELNRAFVEGIDRFGQVLPGFDSPDAILSGVESRTSSPVRIGRDESGQSPVKGIYPCGEGAGYAGGITSAAMDGIGIAEKIAAKYCAFRD